MSDMELVIGTAEKLFHVGSPADMTWEDSVGILIKEGYGLGYVDYEDNYFESNEVLCTSENVFYKLKMTKQNDPSGWIKGEELEDGRINFDCYFYNGGCSWSEAVEEAIAIANEGE